MSLNRIQNPLSQRLLAALALAAWLVVPSVFAQAPTNELVKLLLQQEVDKIHLAPGIVVGIIDEHGSRVLAYGVGDGDGSPPVNGDTVFEIGSLTKVFTTLLLQDMVSHGEVKLDDPISKFLPAGMKLPTRNGKQITLLDLATHTSGLPRLPGNMTAAYIQQHAGNPYVEYNPAMLYDFLAHYDLPRDIGTQYEYSNLGVGLLGHLLARKAGTNYGALVVNRICRPLQMDSTRIRLSSELTARLAAGHDEAGTPVPNWDFDVLAGCGAIRSSVNDLLKFLAANMGQTDSPLAAELQQAHVPLRPADLGRQTGLGWVVSDGVTWHNGGTGGYHSYLGFAPVTRRGVVVLSNSAKGNEALALYILGATAKHEQAQVDHQIYDSYVGTYNLNPQMAITVTRDGDRLMAQLTGQGANEIYPESEAKFFYKVVDAQLTFVKDAAGKVTHVVLHQGGMDQKAVKVVKGKQESAQTDHRLYDSYVGVYSFNPQMAITVTRDGDRLMVQMTGQPAFEAFPSSETEFFLKVVDAQLTFVKDGGGNVTHLILHQGGMDQKAVKVKQGSVQAGTHAYDSYVGVYSFNPQMAITVTRDGDRLLVQLTGQGALEIFPRSETEFFLKVVDAQITFAKNSAGKVTHLILHQNGMNQKAVKVR